MSKMDGLRAMREARHAEMVARSKTAKNAAPKDSAKTTTAPSAPSAPSAKAAGTTPPKAAPGPEPVVEAVCGHRNMSGRTCTREQGHAAKSHRYS